MTERPDLVIFDCDGVLVDSEALANANLAAAVTEWGWAMSPAEARGRWVGRSMSAVGDDLKARLGARLPGDWLEILRLRDEAAFRARLRAVAFADEAVRAVQAAGLATCVASSGSFEKMEVTLGVTGLRPLFEGRIFSSRQVARGKPHPDLFLFAAARMGAAPAACAVVEDSVAGATGAVAAGMRVFGYVGDPETDADGLARAGAALFADMRRLPSLLGLA